MSRAEADLLIEERRLMYEQNKDSRALILPPIGRNLPPRPGTVAR